MFEREVWERKDLYTRAMLVQVGVEFLEVGGVEVGECHARNVKPYAISKAAQLIYEAFLGGGKRSYGVIDKLGLAASVDSLLVALYELQRGVRSAIDNVESREEWGSLSQIVEALALDTNREECVEEALRLAHELAVKALASGGVR